MSKALKWILGVLIVLVVVAVVVGAVFVWRNHAVFAVAPRVATQFGPRTYPPGSQNPQNAPSGPMMYRHGFSRFGRGFGPFGMFMPFGMGFFLGGLFRLIIPLGVLALVAYIFYQMGKRAGASAAGAASQSQSEPAETPRRGRRIAKGE